MHSQQTFFFLFSLKSKKKKKKKITTNSFDNGKKILMTKLQFWVYTQEALHQAKVLSKLLHTSRYNAQSNGHHQQPHDT